MTRRVVWGGRTGSLELAVEGERCRYRFVWDGGRCTEGEVALREVEPGIYSVLNGLRSHEVKIVPGIRGWVVDIEGQHLAFEVEDPRDGAGRDGGLDNDGVVAVTSPMPGRVVRVLVAEGTVVEAGQGLVVVEAMKMQNELKAPKPGRVVEVQAREGAAVTAGEVLVSLE